MTADKTKPPISQGLRLESPTDDPVTTPTHGRQAETMYRLTREVSSEEDKMKDNSKLNDIHDYVVQLWGRKEAVECAMDNAERAFDPRLAEDDPLEDAKQLLEAVLENQKALRENFDRYMAGINDLRVALEEAIEEAENP